MKKAEELIKQQKKIVDIEQKKLNKVFRNEKTYLENKLNALNKTIKGQETLILTEENVDTIIKKYLKKFKEKEIKPINKYSKNNRYLLVTIGLITLYYVNRKNEKVSKHINQYSHLYQNTVNKCIEGIKKKLM